MDDKDLRQFIADAMDAVGDGIWPQFCSNMKQRGYSETECEELTERAIDEMRK